MKQNDFWDRKSTSLYGRLFATKRLYQDYSNYEKNIPQHNDRQIFELLSLGVFAAGLTFNAAFSRRVAFRKVFHNWNLKQVADMSEEEIEQAVKNKAIIRNERKIRATVHNAKIVCKIQRNAGSFDCYLWHFFHNKQNKLSIPKITQLPTTLPATDRLAKQMKKDGFTFVGPVSICAFAICTGLIYVRPDQKGIQTNPVHALTLEEQN